MTTLAEFMIIADADNRPPMLDKTMYDSWKSRMELYIEKRENGRMILNSVENGPLIWPTIEENGETRKKNYEELSTSENLQADCDLNATNIVLQGLPPDVYAIINHHKVAKEIWDIVKLLILPPEWSKFVTDVKLARDLHTTNYDQLYSYLQQHEAHANETRLLHARYQDPLALVANYNLTPSHLNNYHSQYTSPQSWNTNCHDVQPTIIHNAAFQTNDLDAYDFDCDDISSAKAVLMANLSNYGSDVLSEKAQQIKPTLYDGSVISRKHDVIPVTDEEEKLILEEAPRELPKVSLVNTSLKKLKYHLGKFNTMVKKRITPDAITEGSWGFEYTKAVFLNEVIPFLKTLKGIFNVFDKDLLDEITEVQTVFNQMEVAVQQYVMLTMMNSTAVFGDSENLEITQSETCNKCLDLEAELVKRENMVERDLQEKDITINMLRNHIKSLRESDKKGRVKQDMDEIVTINIELEHSVAKLRYENELLHKGIKHLKKIYKDQFDSIKMTRALSKEHSDSLIAQLNSKSMENADLKGQIQEKVFVITALQNELRRLKGKNMLDNASTITNATTIAPGMFKLDIEPISHRLKNNRDAHADYLKKTIENIDTIHGLVERARIQNHSEPLLDSACVFTKHVQELLVYVSKTCPSLTKYSVKLVDVTPKNKDKKVRFADPVTSSNNTQKQVDSHKTQDSNQLLLHSTRVICSTSASGSKPTENIKNNRISQSSSSNKTDKVENQYRSVKSRKNKNNCVAKTECNAYVMQSMVNANSKSVCAICNECLFDENHDKCVLNFVKDVNVRSKSKSTKSNKKQNIWKPTGKVFIEIRYRWKPIGKTFTLVGNSCPLTRITSFKVVHLKETTYKSVEIQKLKIKVYSRKPKPIKFVGSSSKSMIVKSKITNTTKPNQSWGYNASDVPSSSSLVNFRLSRLFSGTVRFGNDQIAKIISYGDYPLGNVTISWVYYVEGLGHNLFSVRQFCDSNLEVSFRKHTCHIRDLDGVDLLKGSRGSNLYTLSLENMMSTSPICLLSKASKTKSWLWHQRLSYLNFEYITQIAKQGMVHGLPRLKFQKDHLCFACALGKSKKHSHKPKAEDSI
ncbi:integrase, catalytic region, zinc finger, CCHC-type containing protein [Tanacetum coccineum]